MARMESRWIDGQLVQVDLDKFDRLIQRRMPAQFRPEVVKPAAPGKRKPVRATSEQVFGPSVGESRSIQRMPSRMAHRAGCSNPDECMAKGAPGCTPPSGKTRRRYKDFAYPLAQAREAAAASQAALAESQAKLAALQARPLP